MKLTPCVHIVVCSKFEMNSLLLAKNTAHFATAAGAVTACKFHFELVARQGLDKCALELDSAVLLAHKAVTLESGCLALGL